MKPPVRLGNITARIVADLRFRRHAKRVHQLGERTTTEALAHLTAMSIDPVEARRVVERFAALSPEQLAAAGADNMPPVPLHEVTP